MGENRLKNEIDLQLKKQTFDHLGLGLINFKENTFESFSYGLKKDSIFKCPEVFFDLASLTKPLTAGVVYQKNKQQFTPENLLCLNHRAGIPAWARLDPKTWEQLVGSYQIQASATVYSDLSSLRLMLDLKQQQNFNFKEIAGEIWDKDCFYWLDRPAQSSFAPTGMRQAKPICGQVHDDNAYVLNQFCTHAGLFSTASALCKTLLNFNQKFDLLANMLGGLKENKDNGRFVGGWDTVTDQQQTLAGEGAGEYCFGHLGFTGTSIWIDAQHQVGHIILSNYTKHAWFDRTELTESRKSLGKACWKLLKKQN